MSDLRQQLQATLSTAYTLERELGGGGMSRVFLATETRLRRAVVVKVLSSEMAAGVSAERFEREIQVAASLQHANIVPLLSAGETNGIPYYTMPFVEGESLRARLATGASVAINDCVSILRDVARALSYAHAHSLVHRDIKPDNILLSHGAAMVTDFGIAKAISAARTQGAGATLTQAGMSIGTPAYMAPEQVAGDAGVDHRADVYAFGCVAYELLTGRPPFGGDSAPRVLAAQLTSPVPPVGVLRADTPAPLARLVMRCLEKDPGTRPSSADEILRSLESVVTTSGNQGQLASGMTRGRWAAMLGTAAVIVVAALLTLTTKGKAARAPEGSIAVLPLANLSGDQANDYFGEGLAEEITGALAKGGMRVVGRGSARALAARGLDARAIAQELSVATVLQGTVQRAGDQVRISVVLASGADGVVLWTNRYDRKLRDIFAVQDEIARSVVAELRSKLGGVVPDSGRQLVRTETTDPEAHSLYLRGLSLWNRRTAPAIHEAIRLFERAVKRDPNYARLCRRRAGVRGAALLRGWQHRQPGEPRSRRRIARPGDRFHVVRGMDGPGVGQLVPMEEQRGTRRLLSRHPTGLDVRHRSVLARPPSRPPRPLRRGGSRVRPGARTRTRVPGHSQWRDHNAHRATPARRGRGHRTADTGDRQFVRRGPGAAGPDP